MKTEENIYPIDFNYQPKFAYSGSIGSFGWITFNKDNIITEISWEVCREMFTWRYINSDKSISIFEFAIRHPLNKGLNIARFINKIENILKLENQTQCHGCINESTISVISPSKWWFENQLRIQLFSILLRCGQHYEDDFDATLNNSYAASTKKAIYKFLDGFTKFQGTESATPTPSDFPPAKTMDWKHGWSWLFSNDKNLDLLIQ